VILALSGPIISCYDITAQTRQIAYELMVSIAIIVVFTAINSILTKGVLRGGGDTKFLMAADVLFLWVASVPLGYLAGLVWHLPPFWIYFFLKIDQFLKAIWCVFRLRSGKWIKRVRGQEAFSSGAPADTDETVRA
jgi:Na+-driven multidrug efflux pump